SRQLEFVDRRDGMLQVLLQHTMELQSLTRGDAEGLIPNRVAQVEVSEHLLARDHPARDAGADHEAVVLAAWYLLGAGLRAEVAIVLLVAAVMLEQREVVFRQEGKVVLQFLG